MEFSIENFLDNHSEIETEIDLDTDEIIWRDENGIFHADIDGAIA